MSFSLITFCVRGWTSFRLFLGFRQSVFNCVKRDDVMSITFSVWVIRPKHLHTFTMCCYPRIYKFKYVPFDEQKINIKRDETIGQWKDVHHADRNSSHCLSVARTLPLYLSEASDFSRCYISLSLPLLCLSVFWSVAVSISLIRSLSSLAFFRFLCRSLSRAPFLVLSPTFSSVCLQSTAVPF